MGIQFLAGQNIFSFSRPSRSSMGPTEDCIQLLVGILSLGVKWSGCETNHLHLSSTMVKSGAPSLPLTPPCVYSACTETPWPLCAFVSAHRAHGLNVFCCDLTLLLWVRSVVRLDLDYEITVCWNVGCKLVLGFCFGLVEVFIPWGCGIIVPDNWCPTFCDHQFVLTRWRLVTW